MKKAGGRLFVRLGKAFIVVFFAWHTFAMAVLAVPFSAKYPVPAWIRANLKPVVDPYAGLTHQWQRWHVFVPENPTYVKRFVLEVAAMGIGNKASMITTDEAGVLQGDDATAQRSIVSIHCRRMGLPSGMPMWFSERDYVFPPDGVLDLPDAAMNRNLEWFQYYKKSFLCP